ncbi:FAD-dependent monooxygenase [Sneathiella sp.]|uniref:FAD-dependent oxidoreductase n=1 Tax=Sneathiella sp. TaxID=1964365 RepID=UPI0025D6386D|nr:FAD-dependent monooxygenase [Sneathiella sp.]
MPDQKKYERAIVTGSGFAGLLAARVLSDYFRQVVIVEKDDEPNAPLPRKGAPQGHHIHVLLNAGEQVLERLFPGIKSEMLEAGSQTAVLGSDVRWRVAGKWMPPFDGGMTTFFQTRPMLELVLRRRVSNVKNISFKYGTKSTEYRLSENDSKITSVTLVDVKTGAESEEEADLFVETSGASTDIIQQLSAMGYPIPRESIVEPDFAYSSCLMEVPENWKWRYRCVLIYPKAPEETRAGAFVPVEGRKWMVTAAGYCGDYPPTTPEEFLEFLKSLPEADVHETVKSAKIVGEIRSFKFKKAIRRHFEELKSFPKGLVVLGDAVCRANPFFGQGITAAALEALALQKNLENISKSGDSIPEAIARPFFKDVAQILDVSWEMAVGEDFKYPTTKGKRPATFALTRWFKDKVMASNDPEVAKQFYRVMHFAEPPTKLLTPKMLYRTFLKR